MSTIFGAERKLSPELLTPDDICASASASSAIAGKSATETNETISNGTGWGDNRELNSVANRKVSHSRWMNQKTALIEKVAERETLVKLMGFIDAMVERKAALLSTIEKCHGCFEINLRRRTNQGLSSSIVNCDTATVCFHRHYAWLLANLELNDQCLDSALTFLVSMYGGAYAGPSKSFAHGDREKVIEIETLVHYLDNFGKGFSEQLWEDWAKAMRKGVEAIGEELFLAIPSLKERKKKARVICQIAERLFWILDFLLYHPCSRLYASALTLLYLPEIILTQKLILTHSQPVGLVEGQCRKHITALIVLVPLLAPFNMFYLIPWKKFNPHHCCQDFLLHLIWNNTQVKRVPLLIWNNWILKGMQDTNI